MRSCLVGVMCLLAVTCLAVPAQAGINEGKGKFGTQFFLDFTGADDYDAVTGYGQFNLTYFVTDKIEVGGGFDIMGNSTDAGGSTSEFINFGFVGIGKYNFVTSEAQTVVPYVGVQAGLNFFDTNDANGDGMTADATVGGLVGVKIFGQENVSFDLEMKQMYTSRDGGVVDTIFTGGFSVYFDKK